jgi:hypothetical protein
MSFDAFENFTLPQFIENEIATDALLVFVHVPRTAGSSFAAELAKLRPDHKHLRADFADGQAMAGDKMDEAVEKFITEIDQRGYRTCSGQIEIRHVDRIRSVEPAAKVVTLLRNPVDRVISDYRSRQINVHPAHEAFVEKYPSINEYIEDPENWDRMTKILAATPGANTTETFRQIDQSFSFVGLLEMYPMSFNIITRFFGQNNLPKIHRNASVLTEEERPAADAELRRRIARNNELDLALYEHVRRRLIAKREAWKSMLVRRRPASTNAPYSATPGAQKQFAGAEQQSEILAAPPAEDNVTTLSTDGAEQLSTTVLGPAKTNITHILRCVGAGVPDFEPYAARVANDPRRLFAFILQSQIARSRHASKTEKAHARAIRDLFDPLHYLENSGPTSACKNPLLHYIRNGWQQRRSPNPLFDTAYYLSQSGEIDTDPLLHYVSVGAQAGLDPHPLFSTRFYSRHIGPGEELNPLFHFQLYGASKRVDPSPLFRTNAAIQNMDLDPFQSSLETYVEHANSPLISTHPIFDVSLYRYQLEIERGQKLCEPALVHYLRVGYRDRSLLPNILFDPQYYREYNNLYHDEPDLIHYLLEGDRLGLSCHPLFSPKFYNQQRKDPGLEITALEHALRHPEAGIKTDPRMERPLDRLIFDFVRQVVEDEREFDSTFYGMANPDVAKLGDGRLRAHFDSHGRGEGRVANARTLMRRHGIGIRDVPLGMSSDEYIELNPDLVAFANKPIRCLMHYLEAGRHEDRPYGFWQFHLDDFVLSALPSSSKKVRAPKAAAPINVCVLVHAFYPELVPELLGFAHNFQNFGTDIFVNVVDLAWNSRIRRDLRKVDPGVYIQLSNDNGRDLGGFMRLLDNIDVDRYDLFAFMHTKKSPHLHEKRATYWRRSLLKAFAGSPDVARECVSLFKSDQKIGMIAAKEFRSNHMGENAKAYERVMDMLGIDADKRELDYVSGTMFMIRRDIVKRLHQSIRFVEWEYGGDNVLSFHLDGQIAHGTERAIPALVRQMGYEIAWR